MADISILANKRVLIVGLGKEGIALASFLAGHNLSVTVTDSQSAAELGEVVERFEADGIRLVLGEHPTRLLDEVDILFVSPGVPLTIPFLKEARSRKIPFSTETRLFCYLCPAPIIALTGSSGKSTTTTLVGEFLQAAGYKTWIGGNIGQPLIEHIAEITPQDRVVMELSSFQLEYFHPRINKGVSANKLAPLLAGWSPSLGALLNITPNHLDRHSSMRTYVRAKRAIIDFQKPEDIIVMSLDNDVTRTIGRQFGDRARWFSIEAERPNGACLYQNQITLLDENKSHQPIIHRQDVKLLGVHNAANIMAAALIARELDISIETMRTVLMRFTGLPYRLELVREHEQVSYYDDSIATTPERMMMALRAFDRPIILIAGGRDKRLSWEETARVIIHKTAHVILFGEARDMIAQVITKAGQDITTTQTQLHLCNSLAETVTIASNFATPGNVVLLSPGCSSYDAFSDYMERGDQFNQLVADL
ncbi:UDP-N-acetylmuramoyl-L-alanine--D-glutamate ligase [Anaerolineales bacterium HSG6]|nr:UDP-N-acetylmuramoyl-L-alanine--D-glutamate ligase [Anaerolineales bacterium HSG6]